MSLNRECACYLITSYAGRLDRPYMCFKVSQRIEILVKQTESLLLTGLNDFRPKNKLLNKLISSF